MRIQCTEGEILVTCRGRPILRHSVERPCLDVGVGRETVFMRHGNFDVRDRLAERIPLRRFKAEKTHDGLRILFTCDEDTIRYELRLSMRPGYLVMEGACGSPRFNRIWLRLEADGQEHVYGLGEQFSSLDHRGRRYPIFTSEQGVGRNKRTQTTFLADCSDNGGGDYWTTYFPQATFISSRMYFFHLYGHPYAEISLEEPDCHEVHQWGAGLNAVIGYADSYPGLMESLSGLLGRQPPLPAWSFDGLWLGVQGGSARSNGMLDRMLEAGTAVCAVWTQDWVGQRVTSFGKRLKWDWLWDRQRYPTLKDDIDRRAGQGIAWMGYINPHLAQDGQLFKEASGNAYLVRNRDGEDYLVDFGEFSGGFVDLTNPDAFAWMKGVIRRNMIDLGLSGWMVDFGEYLPVDCVLFSGQDGIQAHNEWPVLWARVNDEAVRDSGKLGEIAFFTRAGGSGVQRFSPMMFAGDQCVDWSADDGLPSVLNAALSLAMTGFGMFTFDIGGYTALFGMSRSRELLLRGCELAAFTPVMRTHEGNRPDVNHQAYSDGETIAFFSRFSRIHRVLAPYIRSLAALNSEKGHPVMRPLFYHYPQDEEAHRVLYEFLLGPDILVSPVVEEGKEERLLYLPQDQWIHLWSGKGYDGGWHTVPAPLGHPPVFFRALGEAASLIGEIRRIC